MLGSALTKFVYKVADKPEVVQDGTEGKAIDAIAKATVINNQGSVLPGTGGIGTTIFYLGGGAMAAIGGIYLVSKRRMRKSEE
jgi:LPXTG-motif cell wall-anchored protein